MLVDRISRPRLAVSGLFFKRPSSFTRLEPILDLVLLFTPGARPVYFRDCWLFPARLSVLLSPEVRCWTVERMLLFLHWSFLLLLWFLIEMRCDEMR